MIFDDWGGTWSDVEKSPIDEGDDEMCWAATAANILAWTGWGFRDGMTDADEIFGYLTDHWSNEGGMPYFAWDWWFDGDHIRQGWAGWAQVVVPGGGFWPDVAFNDFYRTEVFDWNMGSKVASFLRAGYAVGLAVTGPGNHAISCWGYSFEYPNILECTGVWVTDSDDDKDSLDPPDQLRYYALRHADDRWYLEDFYGSDEWYISDAQGLAIPEPTSIVTLVLGAWGITRRRRVAG
jgi:hypothetical protein